MSLNEDFYIQNVLPIIKRDFLRLIGDDLMFQQGSSRLHMSHFSKNSFKKLLSFSKKTINGLPIHPILIRSLIFSEIRSLNKFHRKNCICCAIFARENEKKSLKNRLRNDLGIDQKYQPFLKMQIFIHTRYTSTVIFTVVVLGEKKEKCNLLTSS